MTWLLHTSQSHAHPSICFHQCRLALGMYALHVRFPPRASIFFCCRMFMVLLIGRRCFIACLTPSFLQCSCLCENKTNSGQGCFSLLFVPPSGQQAPKVGVPKSPFGETGYGCHPTESFISKVFAPKKWWLLMLIISVRFWWSGGTI